MIFFAVLYIVSLGVFLALCHQTPSSSCSGVKFGLLMCSWGSGLVLGLHAL